MPAAIPILVDAAEVLGVAELLHRNRLQSGNPPHRLRRFVGIELLGIELASPFQHPVVFLVLRVSDGLPKLGVAPDAPHVFRWASMLTFDADWIPLAFLRTEAPLEQHLVFPAVPEIVLVEETESLPVLRHDLADLGHGRVGVAKIRLTTFKQLRITVTFAIDLELVEMGVGPAHCGLDAFVELVEGAVLDLNPPPDRRLGVEQRDLELAETLGGGNRADAFGAFEGLRNGIDDVPQRIPIDPLFCVGACGLGLVSDRFEFLGHEGDRAGVLLVELGQQIGNDLALGLGKEDVEEGLPFLAPAR